MMRCKPLNINTRGPRVFALLDELRCHFIEFAAGSHVLQVLFALRVCGVSPCVIRANAAFPLGLHYVYITAAHYAGGAFFTDVLPLNRQRQIKSTQKYPLG